MIDKKDAIAPKVKAQISIKREDVSRAKQWITSGSDGAVDHLRKCWLTANNLPVIAEFDLDSPTLDEDLLAIVNSLNIEGAFFRACFELVVAGEVAFNGEYRKWHPTLFCCAPEFREGLDLGEWAHVQLNGELYLISDPDGFSDDIDVFLHGVSTESLHEGIKLAISESLTAFRKSLFMSAIAMLAAAVEATWTECGVAIAKTQNDQSIQKAIDEQAGIAKLVSMINKTLTSPVGKSLLERANVKVYEVNTAVRWSDELREKRNALHWGKKNSFVAEHSDAAALLMGTPRHIRTIESIRSTC